MKIIQVHQLDHIQREFIRTQLWNKEYPVSIQLPSNQAFLEYLFPLEDKRHYLAIENEEIVGWLMDFIRDEQRFFAMIVLGKQQGKGIGSTLLNTAKANNNRLTGWVIEGNQTLLKQNGEVYKPPISFYERHQFQLLRDVQLKIPQFLMFQIYWKKE